jgi:sulfate permease, SulP family
MGYTKIAGTPVITGLYTILFPLAVFAIFGSSRHLVVGADSATAAILAAGLAGMAATGSEEYVALAGLGALLAALYLFITRLVRLGFLASRRPLRRSTRIAPQPDSRSLRYVSAGGAS